MDTVKTGVAIVGYGGMGGWHVKKLSTMEEGEICGIYDILPLRRKAAQQEGLHAYDTLGELFADPGVEVVTLAVPNDCHKDLAIAAMRAGKNVVCEKPVALSSVELQEIFDVSEETGMLFTVHQNRRWDEDYLTLKKIYENGTLGRVFSIESRVQGSRGIPGDWRNTKEHGGGMVLDWGVHLLDQILMMIREPIESVFAQLTYVTNEAVDDGFKILLRFAPKEGEEEGLCVHVEVGTSNFISLPRWYILGENGSAVIDNWKVDGKIVMVSDWEKRDAVPVVTAAGLTKTMAPRTSETVKEYPLPVVHSDVREFYHNVFKAIRGEEESLIKHEEVMRVMRLMEAVFQSAYTNQAVKLRI
ncbi:Uncharacterized oxidoreductase yvaA [uncultured Clostridium sp.]|nr:Uncharacterized oxidoreductase yvaA [uncultured Clostridium sp.]